MMSPLNEEEELFFKRIHSLKDKALNNYQMSSLKFLDIRKQEIIKYIIGNDAYVYMWGGYEDAEYKKCIISPFELDNPDYKLTILHLDYNHKFLEVNHRKIMACLMDFGIKREVFGDIIFQKGECYIAVSDEMKDYFKESLRTISHVPVELKEYDGIIQNEINYEEKKVFVASLRIDAVISAMYNISRNISQDLVKGELVKVNQAVITNTSHMLKEGDILSVRGKGRFKILEILGNSRSDRIILNLGKYI